MRNGLQEIIWKWLFTLFSHATRRKVRRKARAVKRGLTEKSDHISEEIEHISMPEI